MKKMLAILAMICLVTTTYSVQWNCPHHTRERMRSRGQGLLYCDYYNDSCIYYLKDGRPFNLAPGCPHQAKQG